MKILPKLNEIVSTEYAKQTYSKFRIISNKTYQVIKITHHYKDDMSDIDYTEILLY